MRVLNDVNTYLTVSVLGAVYYLSSPEQEYTWWIDLVASLPKQCQHDDGLAFVVLSQLFLEAGFWFLVVNIHVAERLGWLEPYRLQPRPTNEEVLKRDAELTREALQGVLLSHWVVRPLMMYLLWPYFQLRSGPLRTPIPSARVVMWQVFGCMMIDDTWFYWAHRLFHAVPAFYKAVHKQHHRFMRPNVFATEFAHPVEDLLVNSFGTIVGPLLLGVHPFLLILYPAMKIYQSMEAHSGFNIPFPFSVSSVIDSMDCAPAHDYHHSHNVGNFGGWTMMWDWICGTELKYSKFLMEKKRVSRAYDTARRPYEHDQIGSIKLRSVLDSSAPDSHNE